MRYSDYAIVWQFNTRNFNIKLLVADCMEDPAGQFDDEQMADIQTGRVAYFDAIVSVGWRDGTELGFDSLGSCAYANVQEFFTSHHDADPMNRNCSVMRAVRGENVVICHYFPDMVRQAIADARKRVGGLTAARLKSNKT